MQVCGVLAQSISVGEYSGMKLKVKLKVNTGMRGARTEHFSRKKTLVRSAKNGGRSNKGFQGKKKYWHAVYKNNAGMK